MVGEHEQASVSFVLCKIIGEHEQAMIVCFYRKMAYFDSLGFGCKREPPP